MAILSFMIVALALGEDLGAPARNGLAKLEAALKAHPNGTRVRVIAGLCLGGAAAESLSVRRSNTEGRPAVALCGSDSRGLMYAALDTAARVGWAADQADPLAFVRDVKESPYLAGRGISMYTMHRAYFESRLYDERHWQRYFEMLAASRINSFTVIFGYENGGFMAPAYPYFFDVAAFPEVRMPGLTRERQARNAAAFRRMIQIAHENGIEVIAGIWDHIYRGGVQAGGIPGASELAGKEAPWLVSGVTPENLAPYTKAALKRFLEVFPEIDGLEFRMHNESGLKREEMAGFWHEVFAAMREAKPGMKVTLRAKELPDEIIEDALAQGLKARIETKYWMEQMGLPFHPTHVNRQNMMERRHGYADLLKYPQKYKVHWRLWSGGTTRLLLWGDPAYVRRFAQSARLYDGESFDVNEMLATKMLGEPHDKAPAPVLNPKYRAGEYEFERYWHFYQVWGRVSYNPDTPEEVWAKEFDKRFGAAGRALMKGLHEASGVLPRIVASAYRYQLFPTTRGWAEMMRQGDLPQFADLEGSDIEQFMSPREAARSRIEGTLASKRRPEETSRWFAEKAERILAAAASAESAGASLGGEAQAALADLKILAWLAKYYSARLPAAVSYNVYRETQDVAALASAVAGEREAVAAWREVVRSASDVYASDLAFGVHAVGFPRHWSEELAKLEAGLSRLAAEIPAPPALEFLSSEPARAGHDYTVKVRVRSGARVKQVLLRYRRLKQTEDFASTEMVRESPTDVYTAAIPGWFIDPKWNLMYFVELIDEKGFGRNSPDLEVEMPYVIVSVERGGGR
jgi:hypothetical protein